MAKASSNVISLEFYNKKTDKNEKTFDQILRIAKFIGRANDKTKSIGNKNSKFLLAHIADRIKRSKTGVIFIDHDEISEITECRSDQNLNLIKQLIDIFNFEYHRFIVFEGQKRCYGYTVKYTNDGIERINNPELFYPELLNKKFQIDSRKKSISKPKIFGYEIEKVRPRNRKNSAIHARFLNRNLEIIDINKDLLDLCSSEDIDLSIESQDLKNQDTNFIFSNQTELETNTEFNNMSRVDRMIAKEQARRERDELEGNSFEEVLARAIADRDKQQLTLANQQETAQTEPPKVKVWHTPPQVQTELNDIHTKNGHIYHANRLLNEFDFTDELIDAVREKSDKPHFSNSRIIAIMRNIVASNPKVRIWGGRQAFINYMVKAVNNEKEFTKEEKAQSLAEIKKKEAEQLLYDFQHRVIRYF